MFRKSFAPLLTFPWAVRLSGVRGLRSWRLEVGLGALEVRGSWPAGGSGACLVPIGRRLASGVWPTRRTHTVLRSSISLCGLGSSWDLHNPTHSFSAPELACTGRCEKPSGSDGRHNCLEPEEPGFLVFDFCLGLWATLATLLDFSASISVSVEWPP